MADSMEGTTGASVEETSVAAETTAAASTGAAEALGVLGSLGAFTTLAGAGEAAAGAAAEEVVAGVAVVERFAVSCCFHWFFATPFAPASFAVSRPRCELKVIVLVDPERFGQVSAALTGAGADSSQKTGPSCV